MSFNLCTLPVLMYLLAPLIRCRGREIDASMKLCEPMKQRYFLTIPTHPWLLIPHPTVKVVRA
jgi:hypothetical protein